MLYRRDYLQIYHEIYDEAEYELNDVLVLKKLASLLVTLATGTEPGKYDSLLE